MSKKKFLGYTILDIILITVGIVTVGVTSIVFHSKWYIVLNTILGLLCVFTQAKGKVSTQFIGIVHFCFYIFISFTQQFYGEALLYLIIMLPMYIYGAIHWLRHRDKQDETVIVRSNLSKLEWLFAFIGFVLVSVGVFFLLKTLHTSLLIVNTLSFVSMLPAVYLLIRRCKWNQVAFLVNDFIVPILWVFIVVEGAYQFIPMCIYHVFQIIYDVYGLIEWTKLEKAQKNKAQQ